jgi:tellurite methyltransferase
VSEERRLEKDALRAKWDERYTQTDRVPSPAMVLADNLHLLPPAGKALDLACGLGANALFLVGQGMETTAWDLSPVAIKGLEARAKACGLPVRAEVRDVQLHPPAAGTFDVVVVSHFLDRDLMPAIAAALRPGGLLFYQTFTREAVTDCGPSNPAFRLETNELLRLAGRLVIRVYREEGLLGDTSHGTRDVAMLIAQRPSES